MKTDSLRVRRAELVGAYAKARHRHQAQAALGQRLREATTALLKAEVAETRPKRGRPRIPRPANPELFPIEAGT